MAVGIVFVSHSALIAAGIVELARQMAPDVSLQPAGGTDDGGLGTSAGAVERAILAADDGDGVLVLGDLGSAILTAETAVELLEAPPAAGVLVVDAPIVEGGVAAAVAAQSGADLGSTADAARGRPQTGPAVDGTERRVTLADPDGLHARPAAELVRTVARFDAAVTVDGADARSLLAVLALGARAGARVTVRASGREADEAMAAVADLLAGGSGSA